MDQGMEKNRGICGNTATGTLKLIAITLMIVDHVGIVLFPGVIEMRLLGRIAFPLFAWCICVGSEYTRSFPKYILRMLALFVISQPFYMLGLNHKLMEFNVFATLTLGLVGIYGVRLKKYGSQYLLPLGAVLIACTLQMDYGWRGVVFIMLLYSVRKSREGCIAFMIAFSLFHGSASSSYTSVLGIDLTGLINFFPQGKSLMQSIFRRQTFMLASLPLMLIPFKKDIRCPKWFFYGAYPAHLLILYLIRLVM